MFFHCLPFLACLPMANTMAAKLLQLSQTLSQAAKALPELKLREVAQGIATDLAHLAQTDAAPAADAEEIQRRSPLATAKAYPKDAVTAVCCTRSQVISGSDAGCLKCWCIETWKCLAETQGHQDSILKLEWVEDANSMFSISRDRSLKIWSIGEELQCQQVIEDLPKGVSSLAVLDGTAAIGARDHVIHLWDLVSSRAVGKLRGHTDAVLALDSDRKRSLLVSGGNDRSVRLWDTSTAEVTDCQAVLLGHSGAVTCVAICEQQRLVASGSKDKSVKLWSLDQLICVATLSGHKSYVRAVVFLADGKLATASSDRSCRLWAAKRCVAQLEDHSDSVISLVQTGSGAASRLVSGSDDTTLKIWSLES